MTDKSSIVRTTIIIQATMEIATTRNIGSKCAATSPAPSVAARHKKDAFIWKNLFGSDTDTNRLANAAEETQGHRESTSRDHDQNLWLMANESDVAGSARQPSY